MKNYLLLLLIPLIFIVYSFALKNADGPNYNYGMADPSYVYLLNSLTMSNLEGSGHTDHPGTPLQITGAVILKTYFYISHEKDNITEDVIYQPEAYLRVFDHVLIFLNAIGLYISGLIIYFVFKNVMAGMIFQSIPFVSINILEVFSLIKTENFAFFFIILQIALIIKYIYDPDRDKKKYYLYISGLICGIILATKISFLCIVFLPLIVFPGFRQKMVFVITMISGFVISVVPVLSNMEYFINWISNLFFHSGRYGSGDTSIINSSEFFRNILKIFSNEKFFVFSYLFLFGTSLFIFINRKKNKEIVSSGEIKLCIAVLFAMSIHILMVAKHYSSRYMFPALILSVPALFVSVNILYRIYFLKFGLRFFYAGMLSFLLLFGFYNGRKQLAKSNYIKSECSKLVEFLNTDYNGVSQVLTPGITSEKAALIFAYFYSPVKSRPALSKYIDQRFPGLYWYDVFNEKLILFNGKYESLNISDDKRPIIYRTTDENYNEAFIRNYEKLFKKSNLKLTKLFSNENGELIYKIE